MTSDSSWDPSIYDDEVDEAWYHSNQDLVTKKMQGLPYNQHGLLNVETDSVATEDETDEEGVTIGEAEVYVTMLVEDELVDSVLEWEVNDTFYHRHLDSGDEECEWGDWDVDAHNNWMCYDVEGRKLRPRKPIDYSVTKRHQRGKTQSTDIGSRGGESSKTRQQKNPKAENGDSESREESSTSPDQMKTGDTEEGTGS